MEVDLLHLAAIATIISLLYYHLTKNHNYFHDKPIPSLAVKPIFGSTASLLLKRYSFSDYIKYIYEKFPSVKVFGLFDTSTPFFVIRDPELIKRIAVKDFDHFVDHRVFLASSDDISEANSARLFANSLFSMNGQRWKDMRAILSPAFTGSKMRQMFELMGECCERMVRYFEQEVKRGNGSEIEVEVKDMLARVGLDVIASCAFGMKVDSFKDRDNEFLYQGRKMVNFGRASFIIKMIAFRMFPKLLGGLGLDIVDREQTEYFKKLIKQTVAERESRGIVRNDMIDLLLQARKGELKHHQEKEGQEGFATVQESDLGKGQIRAMTENEMIAQCFIFFVAGFDSVSTSSMFMIYELMQNPDVQEKLYEEVRSTKEALAGKPLSYDVLQQMKYMDMVVSETLRMWSPAAATDRLCVRDYVLDDGEGLKFTIDKGTCVWFPIHGIHHDPKYYPEPEKFLPERFNDENKRNIKQETYLPFGIGPRNCIGSRFALMEVKAILYYMLLKFSFDRSINTEVPLKLKKGFTNLSTEKPIFVKLRRREKC